MINTAYLRTLYFVVALCATAATATACEDWSPENIDNDGDGVPQPQDCDDYDDTVLGAKTWFADSDADKYGDPDNRTLSCDAPKGYVIDNTDCDDTNPSIHPGGLDWLLNGKDENCDGTDAEKAWNLEDAPYSIEGSNIGDGLGSVAVCDLDNDNLDDLIVGATFGNGNHGEVGVFYGSGSKSWFGGMKLFSDADVYITDYDYLIGSWLKCADLDGDGWLDIITVRCECSECLGTAYRRDFAIIGWYGGEGRWSSGPETPDFELAFDLEIEDRYARYRRFSVADIDGDAASEVIVDMFPDNYYGISSGPCGLWVIPGTRYGGSSNLEDVVCNTYDCDKPTLILGSQAIDDLDGDGEIDLALWGVFYGKGNGLVGLLSTPGSDDCVTADFEDSFYTSIYSMDSSGGGLIAAFADIDGNGSTDALVGARGDDRNGRFGGRLYFIENIEEKRDTGLYVIDIAEAIVVGSDAETSFPAYTLVPTDDLNGDGYREVFTADYGGMVHLLSGAVIYGAKSSKPQILTLKETEILAWQTYSSSVLGYGMSTGDFDGDGYKDITIPDINEGRLSGKVSIYLTGDYGL